MNEKSKKAWTRLRSLINNFEKILNNFENFLGGISYVIKESNNKKRKKVVEFKDELHKVKISIIETTVNTETKRYLAISIPEYFSNKAGGINQKYCISEKQLDATTLAEIILIFEVFQTKLYIHNSESVLETLKISEKESPTDEICWRLNEVKLGILEYASQLQN